MRQFLRQQKLQPLLHLPGGLVGEGDRQNLSWIGTMLADQVGNAMGQGTGLAAASAGDHQQWTFVMIDCPTLGVVETGQKAHARNVKGAE